MKNKLTMIAAVMLALSLLPASSLGQRRQKPKPATATKPALTVVNNPTPAPLSGEVNVNVRGDENPIVRLQMTPGGQALVEFPAKDRIFKVNPADPDLVTIEDSPTKETDRYILLRSSKQFLPHAPATGASSAATSMLVQMTSGMVVTLLVYPERDLERVVHRCVIRYERDSVVKARQAAGLAVNLDLRDESVAARPPASIQIAPVTKSQAPAPQPAVATEPATKEEGGSKGKTPPSLPSPIIRASESKERAGEWSGKLKWSKPLHGLRAAAQTRMVNAHQRQVLVTVQNTLNTSVKIVPSLPELAVQTLGDRGRVLQVEPIKSLKIEASATDGLIAPGGTARYIITYEAPILGANQRLCAAIAQINAADEPVIIELTKGTR